MREERELAMGKTLSPRSREGVRWSVGAARHEEGAGGAASAF